MFPKLTIFKLRNDAVYSGKSISTFQTILLPQIKSIRLLSRWRQHDRQHRQHTPTAPQSVTSFHGRRRYNLKFHLTRFHSCRVKSGNGTDETSYWKVNR